MKNLPDILKQFDEEFITRSAFGVSIGAIDNLKESAEEQVHDFISKVYTHAIENCLEALPKDKEQLDKNDPDNYGACYAIGGFNDALLKAEESIRKLLK